MMKLLHVKMFVVIKVIFGKFIFEYYGWSLFFSAIVVLAWKMHFLVKKFYELNGLFFEHTAVANITDTEVVLVLYLKILFNWV